MANESIKAGFQRLWEHTINKIEERVEKEEGKGLSTNDFTDEYKNKVDYTTGKIGIQPDWNQNDETALDYVKNRTHWIEKNPEIILFEEYEVPRELSNELNPPYILSTPFLPEVGQDYVIKINNDKIFYSTAYLEGNRIILPLLTDNGLQFGAIEGQYVYYREGYPLPSTIDIIITTPEEKIYKIDEKFLPKQNILNGESSGSVRTVATNTNIGVAAFAEGYKTTASGNNSHAEGYNTIASGNSSHAEGTLTTAFGESSHAEGFGAEASGNSSHAEGHYTNATGYASHAEGYNAIASGENSHAEGLETEASGYASHAEGWRTIASNENSHAEGCETTASGEGSHAEGEDTIASGNYSHAEGKNTAASGNSSHTEGWETIASDTASHAEGIGTIASGYVSHAEGYETYAYGDFSHTAGIHTIAPSAYMHVIGTCSDIETPPTYTVIKTEWEYPFDKTFTYNILPEEPKTLTGDEDLEYFEISDMTLTTVTGNQLTEGMLVVSGEIYDGNLIDGYYKLVSLSEESTKYNRWMVIYYQATQSIRAKGKYALVVGNGEVNFLNEEVVRRSNAHTLDWDGNAWYAGDVYIGGTGQDNSDKLATEKKVETSIISPKDYFALTDIDNGYTYIVQMKNGNLVSRCGVSSIEVTTMPDKIEYYAGEYFDDSTGMVVTATCEDGSVVEITNYTCSDNKFVIGANTVTISYIEAGNTYATTITVNAIEFDAATILIDFEYTDNGDGTYTITAWKGTKNGVASTEMVVPNSSNIIL